MLTLVLLCRFYLLLRDPEAFAVIKMEIHLGANVGNYFGSLECGSGFCDRYYFDAGMLTAAISSIFFALYDARAFALEKFTR